MSGEALELSRLIERVHQSDEDAASELVERLYPVVIRVVLTHLPVRMTEEDLAQEIFAKVFGRLHQYRPRTGIPFEHWVSRVAHTTCLDALRAEGRRPEIRWSDLSEEQARWVSYLTADSGAVPTTRASAAREVVEYLLKRLGVEDRVLLTLLDLEQRTVREVARLTGWSQPNVKVRAFRARRRLRKQAIALRKKAPHETF